MTVGNRQKHFKMTARSSNSLRERFLGGLEGLGANLENQKRWDPLLDFLKCKSSVAEFFMWVGLCKSDGFKNANQK